jgi:peptidoglycan/LPS O-acetylase OafA/YrhL
VVNTPRINTLDFLRGVAILSVICVICVHVSSAFPIGVRYLDAALGFGRFGVQLFFFVSALTMCHMWELRRDEANPAMKFYIRRFMRIAPLFWLAIPVYLLFNGTGQSYWAPVFLLGCFLYFQLKSGGAPETSRMRLAFLAWVVAAGIVLELPRTNLNFLLVILIEYGLVSLVLRTRIQSSLLERLGKNSYAIYLSHFAVIGIVAWVLRYAAPVHGNAALLAVGFVTVTLVSYILSVGSYHLPEKRVHAFAGRLPVTIYQRALHLQQVQGTPS